MNNDKQMDLFHFDDLMADMSSEIVNRGARNFLMEFQARYPDLYQELKAQMNRDHKQVAVLLKPDATSL